MEMEPHVTLAFALRATPGAYVVLLGAGASVPSGIPHAWDIQQDLIGRLAVAEGAAEIGDPHTWYQERHGRPATYDGLLDALTTTAFERQALLRSYFEPDEQEREEGRKKPTAAHHAIARLVAAGLVRVVLTTNFDRLIETALREAGIEPTVVAHPDDATGLAPLHTLNCLVVHLHGDYLNPTSMLNTPEELDRYSPQVDVLLDRVFADYGLAVAGWSAKWDPALRNAIARSTTRTFTTYWADPRPLADQARDLAILRSATYVPADADTFFGQLADAADALAETGRQHPASIAIAVASAKRALAGNQQAISLHDTLRREFTRIATLPLRTARPWDPADVEAEYGRRLRILETEVEQLLALVATVAYWGSEETDRWWIRDIDQLAVPAHESGKTALLNLVRAPATMVIYAAGIAALAAERWPTLVRILTEPLAENTSKDEVLPAAALLSPHATLSVADAGERLHQQLSATFTDHLALSDTSYTDTWERFEYLRLITARSVGRNTGSPAFIRRTGLMGAYQAAPATWLQRDLERHGKNHPLLQAGFLDGNLEKLQGTKQVLDAEYNHWATQQ
ncbi:SIR2 family protein [Streptomyces sp. NPDC086554]|uniref:SIR2 family protein n=1 Tax=Streptomyces sp. NPDC086554 TaxID=3154864 RepID=UPI003421B9B2